MARAPLALLQGTVDLLVLQALARGPLHGYAVSRWIRLRSGGALGLEDAGLYQALHRLERRGLVEASWGVSENNRRARYYALTGAGRRQLKAETVTWREYAAAVFRVLDPAPRAAEG
jgi:transcriptional regulator